MGFRRSVAAVAVIVALLAGCTGSVAHTQQSTSSVVTTPQTAYPAPPTLDTEMRIPDPLTTNGVTVLQRVVVGTSVSETGLVQGVATAFVPATPDLVAGALVLADATATDATITWSAETNVGEKTLFVAHAAVQPRSVVLSRAKSSGPLTEGIYRVRVTVGSESRDTVFVVSPLATKLDKNSNGRSSLTPARLRTQPTVSESGGGAGGVLSSNGTSDVQPAACFDDEWSPECQDWYDKPTGAPNASPCSNVAVPDVAVEQDEVLPGGEVIISATSVSCRPAGPFAGAAAVNGAPAQALPPGGKWFRNTCELPGRSDLFGDTVQATAAAPNSNQQGSGSIRLGEFVPIPGTPKVDPPLGTEVSDLQTISINAYAIAFGATRGIKTLDVTAPDGSVILHGGREQPATACDLTLPRFQAYGSGTYVVPQDGKAVVELMIRAETFDGSSAQYPLRWAKKPTWTGDLTWHIEQPVPTGTQVQDLSADVVVSETGPYQMTGTMKGIYGQSLTIASCPSNTATPGTSTAQLSGSLDDSGMHLTATPGDTSPPTLSPCPSGGPPAQMGNPATFPQLDQLLAGLAPKANSQYSSVLDVTVPAGMYPFRVQARLTLVPLDQVPIDTAAMAVAAAQPPP